MTHQLLDYLFDYPLETIGILVLAIGFFTIAEKIYKWIKLSKLENNRLAMVIYFLVIVILFSLWVLISDKFNLPSTDLL